MPQRDAKLTAELTALGIDPVATRAALEIDAIMQRWRRRFTKRELGLRAIADLGLDLEQPELDALFAIWAPSQECDGAADGETMVATVADRLSVDPSRASRLTGELIRKGLARRAVSQRDARRTILELTPDGDRIVEAVRTYKFIALGDFLSGWTSEEIAVFIPLLERFHAWSDQTARLPATLTAEIARLRDSLEDRKRA